MNQGDRRGYEFAKKHRTALHGTELTQVKFEPADDGSNLNNNARNLPLIYTKKLLVEGKLR